MKFLECPDVEYLNSLFNSVDLGDTVFFGKLEAYSCKRAGEDKRLAKLLDQQIAAEVSARSPGSPLGSSPFGPLGESQCRKTFIDLIATLNASFPDYDFSNLHASQFNKEPIPSLVVNSINTTLAEMYALVGRSDFSVLLWKTIDENVNISECDIYSYIPDMESDPFSDEGTIWSFNYFFYNRKQKKIVFLACRRIRKPGLLPLDDEDNLSMSSAMLSDSGVDEMDLA